LSEFQQIYNFCAVEDEDEDFEVTRSKVKFTARPTTLLPIDGSPSKTIWFILM